MAFVAGAAPRQLGVDISSSSAGDADECADGTRRAVGTLVLVTGRPAQVGKDRPSSVRTSNQNSVPCRTAIIFACFVAVPHGTTSHLLLRRMVRW